MSCCTVPLTGDHGLEVWNCEIFKFLDFSISRIQIRNTKTVEPTTTTVVRGTAEKLTVVVYV